MGDVLCFWLLFAHVLIYIRVRLDAGFGSAVLVMGSFKQDGGVLLLSGPVSQGSSGSPESSFLLAT